MGSTVSLDDIEPLMPGPAGVDIECTEELGILEKGLRQLEREAPHYAEIVQCRFFDGLTIGETAGVLNSSPSTVKRGWARARSRLHAFMIDAGVDH